MPDALVPASLAVVLFGMLSSLGWGVADFGGGLASRRGPVLGVLLWSQVASLAVGLPLLAATHEPQMRPLDAGLAIFGGLASAAGLALLYKGLSVGRMGVVAPVAAVITAGLPVVFGFVTEGLPPTPALIGVILAVVSVVLVSRSPSTPDGRPSGIWYGIGAGIIFGSFTLSASQLADDLILSPVVLIRLASILTVATWILVRREAWRVPRGILPALLAIGVTDMVATGSYLSAIAIGPLAIAAIIASLYPVVTTALARVVLKERLAPIHVAGIVAAGVAVALIAGASAA